MTKQEALQIAKNKFEQASIEVLQQTVVTIYHDLAIDDSVMDLAMDLLESRMQENDFYAFLDSLD